MQKNFEKERALADMEAKLSEKRYKHSLAVAETARELSFLHGEDPENAYLAGLFHDFAKGFSREESLKCLQEMGEEDPFFLSEPGLAHGPIAAFVLERDYALSDAGILSAIAKHTFGETEMNRLDKIVYLADAIEPNRHYESVEKLRKLAKKDLNEACFEYLKNSLKYLIGDNRKIYLKSVEMYNKMLEGGIDGF